jgi:hypothetical protein
MQSLHIIVLVFACTCALAAQQEHRQIRETEREDSYSFRVRLDRGQSSDLMHCMNQVTDNNINVRMRGDLTTNIDEHSTLSVNTRSRTLAIEHAGAQPDERQRVKEIVARTKRCLDLPSAPIAPGRTSAGGSSSNVSEKESERGYSFHVKTDDIDRQLLNATFGEITGMEVNGQFSGDWNTKDEDGIEIAMHTRRNYLRIDYRGSDAAVRAKAKKKANLVRERFGV